VLQVLKQGDSWNYTSTNQHLLPMPQQQQTPLIDEKELELQV